MQFERFFSRDLYVAVEKKMHDASNYAVTVFARKLRGKGRMEERKRDEKGADSGGSISRTSGRSDSGKRETLVRAPKFV